MRISRAGEARLLAAVVGGLGLAVVAASLTLPGPTPADPVGPRGFPALLGLVLLGSAVGMARPRRAPAGAGEEEDRGTLALRPLLLALGLTAVYLALLEPAGYLLATPPYLAGLLLAQGGVSRRTLLLTALGLPLLLYLLVAVVMRVPLPPGPLEPWLRAL
jgi:putative tricarboxylic transport membrane protein